MQSPGGGKAATEGRYEQQTGPDYIGAESAVEACKSLSRVEQAFRNRDGQIKLPPETDCSPDQLRSHIFLYMLAYYVEWNMRRRLAPLLFECDDRNGHAEGGDP